MASQMKQNLPSKPRNVSNSTLMLKSVKRVPLWKRLFSMKMAKLILLKLIPMSMLMTSSIAALLITLSETKNFA